MNFWEKKLLALLHDPPEKCLDIAQHEERRAAHVRQAFGADADFSWFFSKVSDWTAAAADRFCFPRWPKAASVFTGRDDAPFHHPLGGGKLVFSEERQLPTPDKAEEILLAAQQECCKATWPEAWNAEEVARARFFLLWRFWQEKAAERNPEFAFLPADTRLPDHTIWTHNAVVSALQGCVETEGEGDATEIRSFSPAFLLFQIGPVQDFIAQARTTRDLWSGSYLLSWLVAHAIKAITDKVGPDSILFPSLAGQPLFDFLHKRSLYDPLKMWGDCGHSDEQVLTPNLPNRFLAVLPANRADELAAAAQSAVTDELDRIGSACFAWLIEENPHKPDADEEKRMLARWRQQIADFPTITWQAWPWESDPKKAIDRLAELPGGKFVEEGKKHSPAAALSAAHEAATRGVAKEDLDPRNFRHQSWKEAGQWKSKLIPRPDGAPQIDNPGFAWAAHYAEAEYRLAARRNTRDFGRWAKGDPSCEGAVKDMLSGKEEVIGSEPWQQALAKVEGHHFQESERLGAMNLIKRIWHVAWLNNEHGLERLPRFDSLASVAAAKFAIDVADPEKLRGDGDRWHAFQAFQQEATAAGKDFDAAISKKPQESDWIRWTDASVFHLNEWDRAIRKSKDDDARKRLASARSALASLQAKVDARPLAYVAVLALDGDSMGQWVSGANSPKWVSQLSGEAREYLAKCGGSAAALLDHPRPVSPSYHLQFSEALANFGLYLAREIVLHFRGSLIYSGGDDVLAMLPAENALPCALALRNAFRGEPGLSEALDWILPAKADQWGFVAIDGQHEQMRKRGRFLPRGTALLLPGHNADVSAGIAIGHMHSPLQNLVRAAQAAEKRAKSTYGRAAFAVTLFKRSGETSEWGAKWESGAIGLASEFARLTSERAPSAQDVTQTSPKGAPSQSPGQASAPPWVLDDDRLCPEGAASPPSRKSTPSVSGRFPYALAGLLQPYADGPGWKLKKTDAFDPFKVFPKEIAHVLSRQGKGAPGEFSAQITRYLEQCEGRTLSDFLGPFLTQSFLSRGGEA